jgi:preprotein translocase subunit SecG
MENLSAILLVVQVLLSITLISLVLLQHGKGADAGAAFGSGASATVFGARGSGNFLTRATAIVALLFFITCLALAYIASNREGPSSVMESVMDSQAVEQAAPASVLQPAESPDLPPMEAPAATGEGDAAANTGGDLPPTD